MKTEQHTPGPWAWRLFGDTYTLHADHGRRDTIIGAIPHGQMKYPVVAMSIDGRLKDVDPEHPNAALIASAPELLEALEKAQRLLTMASTECQREEIHKYLSGGYKEAIEEAVFKDAAGIDQAIRKAKSL